MLDFSFLRAQMGEAEAIAFDTETNSDLRLKSPSWVTDDVFMLSLAWGSTREQSFYLDLRASIPGGTKLNLDPEKVAYARQVISWLFFAYPGRIVAHNAKFDLHMIRKTLQLVCGRLVDDTLVMGFILNDIRDRALKPRSAEEFHDESLRTDEAALKAYVKKNKLISYAEVPEEIIASYAAMDTVLTWRLFQWFAPKIEKAFDPIYLNEIKLMRVLVKMEAIGVLVDRPYLERQLEITKPRLLEIQDDVTRQLGFALDLGSDLQLSKYLYEDQGLPVLGTTLKGAPSTDADTLRALTLFTRQDTDAGYSYPYPWLSLILEYRSIVKNNTSFFEPLLHFSLTDGRIHADFNQCGARGGRFSCSKPNLQNQPKPDEDDPITLIARSAFIADPGIPMGFWDQDQIEMRGFAHYSNDPGLIGAFLANEDPYAEVASWIYGGTRLDHPKGTKTRDHGKTIALAIIYGAGGKRIGEATGLGRERGLEILALFKKKSAGSSKFIDTARQRVIDRGWVMNAFGRVSHLEPDKNYIAVNRIIQGWAADVIKHAIVRIDDAGIPLTHEMGLRLNVHDELRYDGLDAEQKAVVVECMTDFTCKVPIKVTFKESSTNWAVAA